MLASGYLGHLGTYFSEIWINIQELSNKEMNLKISLAKLRLFCLSDNMLILMPIDQTLDHKDL